MRILIIRNYPNTMNLEKQSYNIQEIGLAKALNQKGHSCDVVFWTKGKDQQKQVPIGDGRHLTVYYFHAANILKNGVFPKRLDTLADQYDIIQTSEYNQYQAWKYAKRFQNKMVLLHGPYYSPFNIRYNLLCRIFDLFFLNRYRKLNTRFMVKSALAEQFLLGKGIASERISKVYVGIDESFLRHAGTVQAPSFVQAVEALTCPLLLYIGKIEPRRQSLFLLDVLQQVRQSHPDTKLVIVGDGEESYKRQFQARMAELDLQDHVVWSQRIEQKYLSRLYEKAAVFLLPTEFEIFGMVLLEAMYFSSVAVTTYHGGSASLIQNGENGVILDGFSPAQWAGAVCSLLEDDQKRRHIGTAAHRTVAEHFMWDTVSENYLECYQKKLEENRRG